MQLPFTVRIVPPTPPDLKRLVRLRAVWLVAIALLPGMMAIEFFVLASVHRSGPPAPSPGSSYNYDSMILRVANEYDTTFSAI